MNKLKKIHSLENTLHGLKSEENKIMLEYKNEINKSQNLVKTTPAKSVDQNAMPFIDVEMIDRTPKGKTSDANSKFVTQ